MKRLASCWLKDKEKRPWWGEVKCSNLLQQCAVFLFHPSDTFLFDESLCENLILQRNKKTRQKKAHYFSLTRRWPAIPGCQWAERLRARGRDTQKHPNLRFLWNWLIFCEGKCFLVFSWGPHSHRSENTRSISVSQFKHWFQVFYFKDVHKNTFLQSEVQEHFWHFWC